MKILQVCAVDFTLYHFLLPLVREIASRNHEVVVACADGEKAREIRLEGIRVESIPFSRRIGALRQHLRAYRALCVLLRRESFDLVHVHTPLAAAIGRLAAWRTGVPKIAYTAHGFYFHEKMQFWRRWFFLGIEWLLGQITDVLFTQAEEDAVTARRYSLCRGGVVEAILNGVNSEKFHPPSKEGERTKIRLQNGASAETCVIMVIGRLVAEKGYRELFQAIVEVEATLWVVGERLSSDHAQGIKSQIENVKHDPELNKKIRFLGQRNDVPKLLRAADIFVLPSHREGMPRSIIEAMMTSLPVVATDVRGSREEVVHDETGFLVPVRDKDALARSLAGLVRDPILRARMGAAGRARALRLFDERNVIARQMELLGL